MELVQDLLGRAAGELDRISRITNQTLAFHRDTQKPGPIDLAELLANVIALYEGPSSARRIHLVIDAIRRRQFSDIRGSLARCLAI
jgi:signal transduction histidine kinase